MSDAAKRLSVAAGALPEHDRLELVEEILDSLHGVDPDIDKAWAHESEDRLAAYRRGEIPTVGLAEVMAKYRLK